MADCTNKPVMNIVKDDALLYNGRVVRALGVLPGEKLAEVWLDRHECAGTSKQALSGVLLERCTALHATLAHYRFANQSICRFRTAAKADYAADLVFEIDAHDAVGEYVGLAWFDPYIGAAVTVGRRILDHLIGVLEIDPKYITLSVTRMGCRVTVDWRSFGPRRLHELLRVVRYIEAQVFHSDELAELASQFNVPTIEIDTHIYERSDLPKLGVDESNGFTGGWLRPVGAMHHKCGQGGWWYRVTPVPQDWFQPENAAWLVKESRGADANWQAWPERELDQRFLVRVPESRNPALDPAIEADPRPAWKLIELFDRDDLLNHIREDHCDDVRDAQRKARVSPIHVEREYELDESAIAEFVEALEVAVRDRPDRWEMDCPRSSCKQRDRKGAIFKDSGVYVCFRCTGGMSLVALAAELGMSGRLPSRVHSSTPLGTMAISEVPKTPYLSDWGDYVDVVERTFDTPEDLWADRLRMLNRFHRRKNTRVFIDASAPGLGKTTTVQQFLNARAVRHRSFVPREEVQLDYALSLKNAVAVQGRRFGINCTNDALVDVRDRREPVAKTLCSVCPSKTDCTYQAQFAGLGEHDLVLTHGHAGMAHFDMFKNESEIDIVDEDALGTVAQHDDLDAEELDRLRVGLVYDFDVVDADDAAELTAAGYGDVVNHVTLDVVARPSGATPRLERVIAALLRLLAPDAVVKHDINAGRAGELVDLDLALYLLRDGDMRSALEDLNDEDLREHEARRIDLQNDWQAEIAGIQPKGIGLVYPERYEAEWMLSKERAAALNKHDPMEEFFAWHDWVNQHLEPASARRNPRIHRRPKDIIRDLRRQPYNVYYMANTQTNLPLALQAYRPEKSGSWVLRLTTRRPFLSESEKIIHLSATAVPERLRLQYGHPASTRRWTVYKPRLAKQERRIVVADRTYSRAGIFAKKADVLRAELLETADKLIDAEHTRTGLPVAIIGSSQVINWYLKHRLRRAAREFQMPFKGHERAEKSSDLRALTIPLGFICGYAGGVAGSNDFAIEDNGQQRFVRSLIVLGNIIPNLTNVARDQRGLFAHVRDTPVDWTQTSRTVAFEGTERDGMVQVAKNVIGYRDPAANALLFGVYQGELLQIIGRMRGQLADPVDARIVPTVYMFCGVAIPGWPVDEVVTLDDIRERLGLAVKASKPRGRKSGVSLEDQVRRRWEKDGPTATMQWLVSGFYAAIKSDWAVTEARKAIEGAGLDFKGSLIAVGNAVIAELRKANGSTT
jgi:hypothetical protein